MVANSKVWWRTSDPLWIISGQNNLPTKCGFLVEWSHPLKTSQDMLSFCSAKSSYGRVGRCCYGLKNLSKPKNRQEAAESIWYTENREVSFFIKWTYIVDPPRWLLDYIWHFLWGITFSSPGVIKIGQLHIASDQFSLSSLRVKTVMLSNGIKDPCCLSNRVSHTPKCRPHVTYDIIWLMGL